MSNPMMGCGHAANAATADGLPVCAICYGIIPGYDQVAEVDLTGRQALCVYASARRPDEPHGKFGYRTGLVPSDPGLAFFNHRPSQPHDDYYCGCWGFD